MKTQYLMSKTYQVITPDSASRGDSAEDGFEYKDNSFPTLWALAREIRDNGPVEGSSSQIHLHMWYSTVDAICDYRTGNETYYAFHPRDLTIEETTALDAMLHMTDKEFRAIDSEND